MDLLKHSYAAAEDVVSRENRDGSIVLMKTDSSDTFYKITGEASTVWNLLKKGNTAEDALNLLAENFSTVERSTIEKDISGFLSDLKEKTLIVQK